MRSLPTSPFMQRSNQRTLPADYTGDILVWDIDKTYLDTRFSSVRGLLGIVAEAALDKHAVPGAVALLRALRRGGAERPALVPLYFVSGSPPQLRGILERKMTLDGVQWDGITFKDQVALLRARRPKAIKEQVGYKLCALLHYRRELPEGARWFLFGDDVESDAEVFSLFGEVCAGLREGALRQRMAALKAGAPETERALILSADLPVTPNPVERIFIRLERGRPLESFAALSGGVVPVRSFVQAAFILLALGRLRPADVTAVASDMRREHVPEPVLAEHLEDARVRLGVSEDTLRLAQP